MRLRKFTWLLAALVCVPALALAQTRSAMFSNLANPAIGMNALFSGQAARNLDQALWAAVRCSGDQPHLRRGPVLDPREQHRLPGGREVDPEEVWVRSTNIPAFSSSWGSSAARSESTGCSTPTLFPFIQAPVVMANTIGEEGFKDAGMEAAWLTPLPWFSELTGGVYQAIAADDEHPLDFGSTRHDNVPYLGHFKNEFDLNAATTLELGQSILQGRGADGNRHAAYGANVTFRNVPPRNSNRRGWILQSEYLQKGSSVGGTYGREQDGGYASFQYRLSQIWWMGIRGEQARNSFTDFLVDDTGAPIPGTVTRASANIAWTPSEFSFVRLEYSHARADDGHPPDRRPAHGPDELHDRLPPGSRVLRTRRLAHRRTYEP